MKTYRFSGSEFELILEAIGRAREDKVVAMEIVNAGISSHPFAASDFGIPQLDTLSEKINQMLDQFDERKSIWIEVY